MPFWPQRPVWPDLRHQWRRLSFSLTSIGHSLGLQEDRDAGVGQFGLRVMDEMPDILRDLDLDIIEPATQTLGPLGAEYRVVPSPQGICGCGGRGEIR